MRKQRRFVWAAGFALVVGLLAVQPILQCREQPPLPRDVLLDPTPFLPSQREARAPPRVNPRRVTLGVENRTGTRLHLVMYDCAAHFQPDKPYSSLRRHWLLEAGPELQEYGQFQDGSGWFALFVVGEPTVHLLTANLFEGRRPLLIIERRGKGYRATLRQREEGAHD